MSTTETNPFATTESIDEMLASDLRASVRAAAKATEEFVESVAKYGPAYGVGWGESAVRADHEASFAIGVQQAIERGDLTPLEALAAYANEAREDLLRNRFRPSSTSMLHNASTVAKAEAASQFVQKADGFERLYAEVAGA